LEKGYYALHKGTLAGKKKSEARTRQSANLQSPGSF
jgi:hypothetical protein